MLTIHPLAEIFPPMSDEEYAALVEDIRENGLRDAIVLYEGQVLDGRNRHRACVDIGIEPIARPWDGRGDPLSYVISKNLRRRHLSESQRSMVTAKIATMKSGARTDLVPIGTRSPTVSLNEAAQRMNVSERSAKRARVVLAKGVPELVRAVETGNLAVSVAAEIAQHPEEDQVQMMAEPASVRQRFRLPAGASSPERLCRDGLALEAEGIVPDVAAKKVGLQRDTYRKIREVVLLHDRTDLAPSDRKTVDAALAHINQTQTIKQAHERVAPIAARFWGDTAKVRRTNKSMDERIEAFEISMERVMAACMAASELDIPYLSPERSKELVNDLRGAQANLAKLMQRMKEQTKCA